MEHVHVQKQQQQQQQGKIYTLLLLLCKPLAACQNKSVIHDTEGDLIR